MMMMMMMMITIIIIQNGPWLDLHVGQMFFFLSMWTALVQNKLQCGVDFMSQKISGYARLMLV